MFEIVNTDDRGMTGFFLPWPSGSFTIGPGGVSWVTGDLTGKRPSLHGGIDVAFSALIQAF